MASAKKKRDNHLSIKELYHISRPFWWVATSGPFIASYYILNKHANLALWVGVLYFAIFYNLFMYGVNDIYDYESDIRNPRKNQATVLSKTKHRALWLWILATNIPLLGYLAYVGTVQSNLWLLLMAFMVLAYSFQGLRFKEIPLLDSLTSSFHYTSPFIFGGLLARAPNLYLPAFGIFFLWAMANHAFGAIQDITPDKEGGIASVATVFGSSVTTIAVLVAYSAAAALPVVVFGVGGLIPSLLLCTYVILVARTMPYRHDDQNPIFRRSWKQFVWLNYVNGFIMTIFLLLQFKPWL